MLQDIVDNVPKALHTVLLSADGIPRGASDGMDRRAVETISAAMSGMQSLSRAAAKFAGMEPEATWEQTIIEFSHGWVFLIGAGQGAYLAAAAEPDVDMGAISFRMHRLVARLGTNLTTPPRVKADAWAEQADRARERAGGGAGAGIAIADLDAAFGDVRGARNAVLLRSDGLPRGATTSMSRDLVDTISAAMQGLHAYSRATSRFAGVQDARWRQTVIEFSHGWVFLVPAGGGSLLAAAAEPETDIAKFATQLHEDVVPRLSTHLAASKEASRR
ncbi:roadblock/LC7 domain-containing protein [Streptomyces mexicanus]|uniref:Roadblock/LC7 domain-containing protein n=2 Tax=Streptomyces mexicanus TaxID=178566 RepID=A0A7X1I6T5_9ACTN|nr:roadblock/LC7 domain-containing protein [Streptomyces mexicanus]